MRDEIASALQAASTGEDKRRICTLRLIGAALRDRDEAQRASGHDRLSDTEISQMLVAMVRQRDCAAATLDANGQGDEAAGKRAEIAVIQELLPAPFAATEIEAVCRQVVSETGSKGLRDVGRCMNALKTRYEDKLNLIEASSVVRGLLS